VEVLPFSCSKKMRRGIIDGPDNRNIVREKQFPHTITDVERRAWNGFISDIRNVLSSYGLCTILRGFEEIIDAHKDTKYNLSI